LLNNFPQGRVTKQKKGQNNSNYFIVGYMKKIACIALLLLAMIPRSLLADDSNVGAADAAASAIDMSMVGWGVGLTAAIATVVILIPPETEGTSHAHGN
jgi:hypothetical protein